LFGDGQAPRLGDVHESPEARTAQRSDIRPGGLGISQGTDDMESHRKLQKYTYGLYTKNIHIETFYRFMRVRRTKLGHISEPNTGKLDFERTKDVQHSIGNASKSLI
jgi:hypothetical protein